MANRRRFRRPRRRHSVERDFSFVVPCLLSFLFATPAHGATFESTPIWPDVSVFGPEAAEAAWSKQLFGDVWAGAVIAHTDLYDRFPYVEQREYLVVSDPSWSRLLAGEAGVGLSAWDGAGTSVGPLREPRGITVDENDRVFVCDSGNNRVVVLQAHTEGAEITLEALYAIDDIARPYALAVTDGGTPFTPGDDRLYVAETGRNRVAAYQLEEGGARFIFALGELGSGRGYFAGPMAIAARGEEILVSDAHNQRIVRLADRGDHLEWVDDRRFDAGMVSSLQIDPWGGVVAVCPQASALVRLSPSLEPVARLDQSLSRPRGVALVSRVLSDHRSGRRRVEPVDRALMVDEWRSGSGLSLWKLGVAVEDVHWTDDGAIDLRLTDAASVTLERAGEALVQANLAAGSHRLELPAGVDPADTRGLRVVARSRYEGGATASAAMEQGAVPRDGFRVRSAAPNPSSVSIAFQLELAPAAGAVEINLFDVEGRKVRHLASEPAGTSIFTVLWDGRDERGRPVGSGLYLYSARQGLQERSGRVVMLR